MDVADIKTYLKEDKKVIKKPVTIYLDNTDLTKLDRIVKNTSTSRTAIVAAMINLFTKRKTKND